MQSLSNLAERDFLAFAISSEEEDGRIYADFAHDLRDEHLASAQVFTDMAAEENEGRRRLTHTFVARLGSHIPLVCREGVRGWVRGRPAWQARPLGIKAVRRHVRQMERDAGRFYQHAAAGTSDAATREVLGDLAAAEAEHERVAGTIEERHLPDGVREAEDDSAHRRFVLQYVQPGLAGLIDGSVSTLAPVFATHNSWDAFLIGIAASVGAGISMGFAEALADDGKLSGHGKPWMRGVVWCAAS